MKNIDEQYLDLLNDILENGVKKTDRTGTGTISVFGRQLRHKMLEGFPALTTKELAWKQVYTELQWFLQGKTNIQPLVMQGNNIWVGDAYKQYLTKMSELESQGNHSEMNKWMSNWDDGTLSLLTKKLFIEQIKTNDKFAEKWGELGPVYGKQWRDWGGIDQIANAIDMLKTNPDSRRIIVSAWNPSDVPDMTLPPCHNFFQFYTKELSFYERCLIAIKDGWMTPWGMFDTPETRYTLEYNNVPTRSVSLMWNQRSVDTPLGLPFNIASYGLLLEIIAKEVEMAPGELIGNLGDVHIYANQIDGVEEQLGREPKKLPKLELNAELVTNLEDKDFDTAINGIFIPKLIDYNPHPKIKFPLSN